MQKLIIAAVEAKICFLGNNNKNRRIYIFKILLVASAEEDCNKS